MKVLSDETLKRIADSGKCDSAEAHLMVIELREARGREIGVSELKRQMRVSEEAARALIYAYDRGVSRLGLP